MYFDRRVIPLLQEILVTEANDEVRVFYQKLPNRCLCAREVKICQNRHNCSAFIGNRGR